MREQIITPRVNGRVALTGARTRSGEIMQRPARRGSSSRGQESALRRFLGYMPFIGKLGIALITCVLIFAGYRAAGSASLFETKNIDISGTSRTSPAAVKEIVRRATTASGVWRADLEAITKEVEKLPWVRSAVVSRVLPDGLRVRVVERVPRAVVRTQAGKFVWVDDDAVSLSHMSATDQMPVFFIRGWDESGTNDARNENRERIQKYLEMSREWEALGLSERVSEVNIGDPHDIRALLAADDAQIEVRLGERNFGSRLQKALKVLDEQRATPLGPFITYLVASQDGKITVGHSAGAPVSSVNDGISASNNTTAEPPKTLDRSTVSSTPKKNARNEAKPKDERGGVVQKSNSQAVKSTETKKETRPRRVG